MSTIPRRPAPSRVRKRKSQLRRPTRRRSSTAGGKCAPQGTERPSPGLTLSTPGSGKRTVPTRERRNEGFPRHREFGLEIDALLNDARPARGFWTAAKPRPQNPPP